MEAIPGISLFYASTILPYQSNHFSPSQTNEPAGEPVLKTESSKTEECKGHALVVDDVPDVTDMLSVLLMHAGWEVVTAESAAAALAAARRAGARGDRHRRGSQRLPGASGGPADRAGHRGRDPHRRGGAQVRPRAADRDATGREGRQERPQSVQHPDHPEGDEPE